MSILRTHDEDRVQVFIDGQNMHGTLRSIGRKLDWKAFLDYFETETRLIRMNYITAIRSQQANDTFNRVLKFLDSNGYTMVTKPVRDHIDDAGNIRVRGTMTGEMTVAMTRAARNGTDHIFLFSGDSELCAAVQECKEEGARVTVVSTQNVISEDLFVLADDFIAIENLPKELFMD